MKITGVFATKKEIDILFEAASAPYMLIGGQPPPDARKMCHAYALAHGLPEIRGYYGIKRTGEFVSD